MTTKFQTCSYWHDHPVGDPSYDDCEHAADIQRARLAQKEQTPMHSVTITPLPFASEPNHPERIACYGCDQLATINWRWSDTDFALCPEHAGEWAQAYADPDAEEWLGR